MACHWLRPRRSPIGMLGAESQLQPPPRQCPPEIEACQVLLDLLALNSQTGHQGGQHTRTGNLLVRIL